MRTFLFPKTIRQGEEGKWATCDFLKRETGDMSQYGMAFKQESTICKTTDSERKQKHAQ